MSSSPNLHSVFVYGSLMADDVLQVLLRRVPSSSPAALSDFHRFSIKECVYPAIIPAKSKKVTGKVLLGLTDDELDVLDAFEGDEYKRRAVEISLIDKSEKLSADPYAWVKENDGLYGEWDFEDKSEKLFADTYVWVNENDPNLYGEWNFEEWKLLYIGDFLVMTREFIEEYLMR